MTILLDIFANNHNLVMVYMKCDYTHLNHNWLVSQKKMVTQGFTVYWLLETKLG